MPIFDGFRRVSASLETDPTRQTSDPRNPTLLMGRLRVGFLQTRSLTGWLRVGHKLDPPDPWTALVLLLWLLVDFHGLWWWLFLLLLVGYEVQVYLEGLEI